MITVVLFTLCVCAHARTDVHVCVCVCVCACVCMHVCVCVYTHVCSCVYVCLCLLQEQLFISDGFDGSATNYTITYSDSASGRTCDSVTISASACINGLCNHMFDIPSACFNFDSIIITVFASSVLGDGPPSKSICLEFSK